MYLGSKKTTKGEMNMPLLTDFRKKPWDGIGKEVVSAPTSAEAIKRAGLDWEVVSAQSEYFLNGVHTIVPEQFDNVRVDTGQSFGRVTGRYKITQNIECFDFLDNLAGNAITYETAGAIEGGKRVFLSTKLKNFDHKILGDEMEYYLFLSNSHDGKGAIRIAITPVRLVCSNVLNLALKQASRSWSAVHSSLLATKMEEAKNTLFMAESYVNALQEEADLLSQVIVPMDTFRFVSESLFPITKEMPDRQKRNNEELKSELEMRYNFDDIKKFNGTGWGVIQAVSDLVGHRKPQRETDTYQEKNFAKIIDGHNLFDKAYGLIKKVV